ncbi:L-proline dehydrogenase [Salimicrobium album]|uniref:proline dehydrogenase n=2 Tax=Salimicrobium TaxID=351195 RepID=A0ABY1KU62_9BACI|nr:L-proline dehydrogenase [Salimicrobium album]SIS76928.1 L-proline dehydrogenase [Salimicrobium salexigens]
MLNLQAITKNFFLFLSNNKTLDRLAKQYGTRFGVDKLVGGETFSQAVPVIRQLNDEGLVVTVDHLGEFVDSEEEAKERAGEAVETVQTMFDHNLACEMSVKLTSLGLDISRELVIRNMERILDKAQELGITLQIDMEDSGRCQATIDVFKELRAKYPNVGLVIQSYLYRSDRDLDELDKYDPYVRLVKGAYKEPGTVAFQDKDMVDKNLKQLVKKHMLNGNYTAVGSHDEEVINFTKELAREHGISKDRFEFQMLYGMRNKLQHDLAKEGYTVRVYMPYGMEWYGYYMRRLAERPANIAFAVKGIFSR